MRLFSWRERRRRRFGTGTRLMIWYAFLLFVVIGAIIIQSDRVLDRRMQQALNNDLAEQIVEFDAAAAARPAEQSLEEFTSAYLRAHLRPRGVLLVIRLTADPATPASVPTVLSTPGADALIASTKVTNWLDHPPPVTELADIRIPGATLRARVSEIVIGGRHRGLLIAADDIDPLNRDRRSQLLVIGAEGAAALAVAILGGYLLIRRVLRVVARVADTAEEITVSGDLSRRLHLGGPDDEVGRLSRTVDHMLERVDEAFRDRAELLADVSHQLRTPLTIVRGHLQVLSRDGFADPDEVAEVVAVVIDEIDQLSMLVERMLLLGQALERNFLVEESIDVAEFTGEVFEAARFLGERDWRLDCAESVVLRGDRAKLRGALLNLLDNAVEATAEGDRITLAARSGSAGGFVFEVSDTGRGLDQQKASEMMGRFVRSKSSRYRGSGLGLAIVNAVATAHGGTVVLESSPGQGCTVRVLLPSSRIARQVAGAGVR